MRSRIEFLPNIKGNLDTTRYEHSEYFTADGRNNSCSEVIRIRGGEWYNGTLWFDTMMGKHLNLWPTDVETIYMEENL